MWALDNCQPTRDCSGHGWFSPGVKPMRRTLLMAGLTLALAVGAVLWANALMGSLSTYRSPFHGRTVPAGERLGPPLTRRLVFVYVDGLRVDTAANAQVMPFLNELRGHAASAVAHSRQPSYSVPGYTTMLSGAWPEFNDGPLLNPDEEHLVPWPQDNLFAAAKRAGLKVALADHYSGERLVPQDALDDHYYTHGEDDTDDRAVTAAAVRWLHEGAQQFILVHLDQVDDTGHKYGPRSPNWNAAAGRVDVLLRELGNALDLSRDTIFITSDHGHIDQGGHGGHEDVVVHEPWILAGAGVKPGQYGDTQMVDIAPTLAALLGASLPSLNQGHVRTDMLQVNQDQRDHITDVVRKQQLQWVYAYLLATARPTLQLGATGDPVDDAQGGVDRARSAEFAWTGLMRAALVAVLMLAVVLALWFAHEPVNHWQLIAAVAYLAVFHATYALIEGRTYSLSSVLSANDIIRACLLTAGLAIAAAIALLLWRTTTLQSGALASAESVLAMVLVTMAIVAVPAIVGYVVNGAVITWHIPNFPLMFMTFISLLQVAGIGVFGVVLAGLAAFASRFVAASRS